jgi:hypothetical protein
MDIPSQIFAQILSPGNLPNLLAFLGIAAVAALLGAGKRRRRPRGRVAQARSGPTNGHIGDPATQMIWISQVGFEKVSLLNNEEARVLPVLEAAVRQFGQGHRVMAQVSLGEIIRPTATSGTTDARQNAYRSINSKRIDFGIFDRRGMLTAAIEYQGTGHYRDKTFMRDAVKREALRKAGVAYVEVRPGFVPDDLTAQIAPFLNAPAAA